jgi:hypothetical protein
VSRPPPPPTIISLLDGLEAQGGPPWQPYGQSVQGRKLMAAALGRPATDRGSAGAILFLGGVHGDEPLGPELCMRLVPVLAAASLWRPLWIVPAANPDGLASNSKNNAHSVDLNRNFPSRSWSPAPPDHTLGHEEGYSPGPQPLSEPESRALAALIESASVRRIIAIHEPLHVVNFDGPAEVLACRMAACCGYPVAADLGYPTPGSMGSYYGHDLGLEVITLELPRLAPEEAWNEVQEALLAALP